MKEPKAPRRQCRNCEKTVRSWTKTIMCCGRPMGCEIIKKTVDD